MLAQCDGQRVLFQDLDAEGTRPTIEPLEVFASQWSGELMLVASRASLAGELASSTSAGSSPASSSTASCWARCC